MKLLLLFMFIFLSSCNSPTQKLAPIPNSDSHKAAFPQTPYSAKYYWAKGPYGEVDKENTLVVFLYKNQELHSLPSDLSIEFYATMPSMGHPLEDAGYFQELSPGIYINEHIKYNMSGEWKNELQIMNSAFNIQDKISWSEFLQ